MTEARELEIYLRRLKWSLAEVPETERAEIIAETRAHIRERLDKGFALKEILTDFGLAEDYARGFLDERQLVGALGTQRSTDLAGAVARRAHRSLVAFAALTALILLSMSALVMAALTIMKLIDPTHVGLWISEKQKFLGIIDNPSLAREVLGNWVYPLAAAVIAFGWLAGRGVLSIAVRTLAQAERRTGVKR